MKNIKIQSFIIFIVSFILAYLFICYLPSFKVGLIAPPLERFIVNFKYMALFKSIVSSIFAGLCVIFVHYIRK